MLRLEAPRPTSLALSMPLSSRVILPVVSALEQISLTHSDSPNHRPSPPPSPPPSQGEDMITDKDQPSTQHQVSSSFVKLALFYDFGALGYCTPSNHSRLLWCLYGFISPDHDFDGSPPLP